jgi:4,5-dihydroxyphthalate decarboxylase
MRLTLACADYDRTRPVIDGRVPIEGCEASIQCLDFEDMFVRALTTAEFDATELSFSRFALNVARGSTPYIGLPIFLSRTFRHSAIYVRSDRAIRDPGDLRGKRIGVRDYANTASLVARGMLEDVYGLGARDVHWIVGDIDHAERKVIRLPELPPGFSVAVAPAARLLSPMLADGELDGLIDYQPPGCFVEEHPAVRRLFPDYQIAEREYFERTRIFPIMHVLVLKRDIAQREGWVAESLYRAFAQAKDLALAHLWSPGALRISLPWISEEYRRTVALMGEDFWPYGIAANRAPIESIVRYLHAQGLAPRRLALEELFAPSLLDT